MARDRLTRHLTRNPHLPGSEISDIDAFAGRVLGGRFALVSPLAGARRRYLAYDALDRRIVEVEIGSQDDLPFFRDLVQTSAAVDDVRVLSYVAWGVHSCGSAGIVAYVASEFIPGSVSLGEHRVRSGPLPTQEIEIVVEAISAALDACRRQGVATAPTRLEDVVVVTIPGYPTLVKLRAIPRPLESAAALRREHVRELELPVHEERQRGVTDDHQRDLSDLVTRLR